MVYTHRWSEEEKKTLRDHYAYISNEDLSKALPGRTARSLNDCAQRMGLKKSQDRLREMAQANISKRKDRQSEPQDPG